MYTVVHCTKFAIHKAMEWYLVVAQRSTWCVYLWLFANRKPNHLRMLCSLCAAQGPSNWGSKLLVPWGLLWATGRQAMQLLQARVQNRALQAKHQWRLISWIQLVHSGVRRLTFSRMYSKTMSRAWHTSTRANSNHSVIAFCILLQGDIVECCTAGRTAKS